MFGATATTEAVESVELTELAGSLLSLVLWFIFGAGFVIRPSRISMSASPCMPSPA